MLLNKRILTALFSSLAFLAYHHSAAATDLVVDIKSNQGKKIGTVKLEEMEKGVKLNLDIQGLRPGEYAFHFHEKGRCQGPDFKSAGDHFNPDNQKHGFDVAHGPHAGDMPNLIVPKSQTVKLEVINPNVSLRDGKNSLTKKGGTALVIHSEGGDYKTQPSGDAGNRIACGVIKGKNLG